jgi:hypothetical protein
MRDFQEFINKKIAVSFKTIDEKWDFVDLCHKNGFMYFDESENGRMWENKFLHHASEYCRDPITICCDTETCLIGYDIVPASEFLQSQATIEIFRAKKTVVCLKKQGGKVIARGVARCSKDDEFNFDYGAELALTRMIDSCRVKKYYEKVKENGLPEYFNVQGDAVDVVLPKIKTLKDGTKIIKQDNYQVGDVIVFKKDLIPIGCLRTAKITETSDVYLFRFGGIGWYSINRIKGKVIE